MTWADPPVRDAAIRLMDALVERYAAAGVAVDHDVLVGIDAPQILAARHRIALHRGGAPLHVTTGRLGDVLEEVQRARAAARERHGWVVDTYLLRGPASTVNGPAPTGLPAAGVLSDGVLSLRPMTADDWVVVRDEHNDSESLRWDFDGVPLSDDDARRRAARGPLEWRRGRAARFAMVDAESGDGAGVLALLRMGPPGTGLVGYGVLPGFRGRGFTTRALRLVARWAFEEVGLARLELGHKVGNLASGRAAEGAGFRAEGRLSARLPNPDGSRSDEVVYSLVRPGTDSQASMHHA